MKRLYLLEIHHVNPISHNTIQDLNYIVENIILMMPQNVSQINNTKKMNAYLNGARLIPLSEMSQLRD